MTGKKGMMGNLGCERIQDDLKAYLDGELRWPASWSVRRHLGACADCRQELSEMEALQIRVRASDPGELPVYLRDRILAAAAQVQPPAPVRSSAPRRLPTLALGAVAGVLLMLVICLPAIMRLGGLPFPTENLARKAAAPAGAPPAAGSGPVAFMERSNASGTGAANLAGEPAVGGSAKRSGAGPAAMRASPSASSLASTGPPAGKSILPEHQAKTVDKPAAKSSQQNAQSGAVNFAAADANSFKYAANANEETNAAKSFVDRSKQVAGKDLGAKKATALMDNIAPAAAAGAGGRFASKPAPLGVTPGLATANAASEVDMTLLVDNVPQKATNVLEVAQANGAVLGARDKSSNHLAADAAVQVLTFDVPVSNLSETVEQIKKQGELVDRQAFGRSLAQSYGMQDAGRQSPQQNNSLSEREGLNNAHNAASARNQAGFGAGGQAGGFGGSLAAGGGAAGPGTVQQQRGAKSDGPAGQVELRSENQPSARNNRNSRRAASQVQAGSSLNLSQASERAPMGAQGGRKTGAQNVLARKEAAQALPGYARVRVRLQLKPPPAQKKP